MKSFCLCYSNAVEFCVSDSVETHVLLFVVFYLRKKGKFSSIKEASLYTLNGPVVLLVPLIYVNRQTPHAKEMQLCLYMLCF